MWVLEELGNQMRWWGNTEMVEAGRHYHPRMRHRTRCWGNGWSHGEAPWFYLAPWRVGFLGIYCCGGDLATTRMNSILSEVERKGNIPWHPPSSPSSTFHWWDYPDPEGKGSSALQCLEKLSGQGAGTSLRADRQWTSPMSWVCFIYSSVSKHLGCPDWSPIIGHVVYFNFFLL